MIYATRFGSTDASFTLDKNDGRGPVRIDLPAGVAHFLEHKMFESEEGDAFALYAKTGANANAYTSFDRTSYIFTATGKIDESLDVLLGMVGKPYFTEATIAKEQGIIGQEIRMYDDSADWRLLTGLCQCLYAHHPVRSDIAGTVESIAQITPEMLYACTDAFYQPANMVLAAAGNITMEQLEAACARAGLNEPRQPYPVQRILAGEPLTPARDRMEFSMPVAKPCIGIGFKEAPLPDGVAGLRGRVICDLLTELIVGGTTPLYRRLYDEGLVNPEFDGISCRWTAASALPLPARATSPSGCGTAAGRDRPAAGRRGGRGTVPPEQKPDVRRTDPGPGADRRHRRRDGQLFFTWAYRVR